jgi:hypothetical protein
VQWPEGLTTYAFIHSLTPIMFYLNEAWVNKNHSPGRTWRDSRDKGGLKLSLGKVGRGIVHHLGLN